MLGSRFIIKGFKISSSSLSIIVRGGFNLLNNNEGFVLDLGCGNGRNSLYALQKGCCVDAVGMVDSGILKELSAEYAGRVCFFKQSFNDFKIKNNYYCAVMLTRVIQYLNNPVLT